MRKGLLTAVVLAGGLVFSTVGCFNNGGKKQDKHEYTVSIDNKEELQAEWLSDGQGRSLSLTITKDGVEQNATKAINDGELTFTVADNEVVRVQGRVVAPVGAGTTTVTAKYGKATDSVEVTITASNPHGKSEDDPLTVAEAIAVCQETGTTATSIDYYIRGIVVNAEAYSEQFGNITFNIGDTIDSTAVVKVFRAKPIQNPPYDPTKISKGSEVLVKGKLVNYNSNTPELDAGGSILTATAGHQAQTIQATVAEALAAAQALGDNLTSDDKYEITGYITSVVPGSGFYMSDTKGAVDPSQDQFLVYYGSTTMPEDATVNAKVKVLDKIKHYVSTSTAGKYAYETASTGPEEYTLLEPGDAPAQTIEATVTEALAAIAELADGATTTDKYKVTGYVISPEAYSTQFNNITFMMGDTADAAANAQLKAFRVSTTAEIGARILAGAVVSVEGYLQKYVKNETVTPELVSGGEVTIVSDPEVPELTGIELTPATLSADVLNGEVKKQLTVSPVPERAELGTVTYTVDPADAGVTVSSTGEVTVAQTAVEDDQTKTFTITATCGDFSDTATLTVTKDTAGGGGQDEPDVKITDLKNGDTVTDLKARVMAVGSDNKNFFIDDGYAGILAYASAATTGISAGDCVTVSGTVSTYNKALQIGSAVLTKSQEAAPTPTTATALSAEEAAAMLSANPTPIGGRYSLRTGAVSASGNYLVWSFGSIQMENGAKCTAGMQAGKVYDIEGYIGGIYSTYLLFVPTAATEVAIDVEGIALDKTEATVKQGATLQLNASATPAGAQFSSTVQWSTSDATGKISVSSTGLVSVAEDATVGAKATITATYNAFTATCEITVAEASSSISKLAAYTFTNTKDTAAVSDGSTIVGWFTKTEGESIVTSASNPSYVYAGASGGTGDNTWETGNSLKIGKASAGGSLTLGLSTNVSKVVIKGYGWKNAVVVTVNTVTSNVFQSYLCNKTTVAAGTVGTAEFEITSSGSITISTNSTALLITAIEFWG